MAPLELGRLRHDIEAFQGEMMEEFYANFAGLKDDMSTVAIYDRYAHLFSKDAIAVADEALEAPAREDDTRWAKYMKAFSTMGYLESAVKEYTDRINTFEAKSAVEFEGESIPYRFVPIKLRNEPDHERRRRLFEAKLAETDKVNEILLERMTFVHDIAGELGFKNYKEMCSTLKGVDYRALEDQMEEMLHRTEKLYVTHMDEFMRQHTGLALTDAWSYDIPYAFKGEEYDAFFAKDKLVDAFFATLRAMGIEPGKYKNITIDTEERPKKTPRAFCAPVKVPEDVRLVIRPVGGWRDYDAFFHEGGHAWHFGNTRKDHPAEYRYLGDNSVTEAFAFLFNYLPSNRLWLKKFLGMDDADAYIKFVQINKLMFLRRYASKLVYEMKMHQGKVSRDFGEIYKNCLQKGLRFKHTEKHYLEDVDDAFYCAEYLRAWIFEGQLREALVEKFGDGWFENVKAGDYLRELWSYGQKYTADELVKTVGYVELDFEPVISEIERALSE
jgi:hypothetical protein